MPRIGNEYIGNGQGGIVIDKLTTKQRHKKVEERSQGIKMEIWKCSQCGKDKKLNTSNFYRDKRRKTGFKAECKNCGNKKQLKHKYICNSCNKEFLSRKKYTDAKYCSRKCFGLSLEGIRGEDTPQYRGDERKRVCPVCNMEYIEHWKGATKTCSVECANIYMRKRVKVICRNCGNQFEKRESEVYWHAERGYENHFCTRKCKDNFNVEENSPCWIKDRSKIKSKNNSIRFGHSMNQWRSEVYERDNYTCKMCGNRSSKGNRVTLNAHHIKRFNDYPKLRTDVNNGITLCEPCHKKTYCKEEEYEEMFYGLIRKDKEC